MAARDLRSILVSNLDMVRSMTGLVGRRPLRPGQGPEEGVTKSGDQPASKNCSLHCSLEAYYLADREEVVGLESLMQSLVSI